MKKHMFHVTVHRLRKTTDVVVAATDEIDAARKAFDNMVPKGGAHPEKYVVWRVMSADEFEENIGFLRPSHFNGCDGEELIRMFLINRKEVRL